MDDMLKLWIDNFSHLVPAKFGKIKKQTNQTKQIEIQIQKH